MKDKTVIFDIDGTLADASYRLGFIEDPDRKDWESFFMAENMMKDLPIEPTVEIIAGLEPLFPIMFLTARPERTRMTTINWLGKHLPWLSSYKLLMRADGDRRPSHEVKRDILFNDLLLPERPILCAFEDRAEDAKMYRASGVTCWLIDEGRF